MVNWLPILFQIGGTGTIILVTVGLMGWWLWGKINKALDSYSDNYLEQKATIDARLASIEKLVEEQARLTRTVEGIKDEIAAQAKSRDNRWEFRKDVYVNLLTAANLVQQGWASISVYPPAMYEKGPGYERIVEMFRIELDKMASNTNEFIKYASLAPLAMADSVMPLVHEALKITNEPTDLNSPDIRPMADRKGSALSALITGLQAAARKDLWGIPE